MRLICSCLTHVVSSAVRCIEIAPDTNIVDFNIHDYCTQNYQELCTVWEVSAVHHVFPFVDLLELVFADPFDGSPSIAAKTKYQWRRFAFSNTLASDDIEDNFDTLFRVSKLLLTDSYARFVVNNFSPLVRNVAHLRGLRHPSR